jgi:hypothetical protein
MRFWPRFKKSTLLKWMSYWPPFFGAGIRIREISDDFTYVRVEMKLRFWNRNYVGTHFGGSLYSMVDPFYMLMLIENLGRDYIVWDKSASIRFLKPGRGRVSAEFRRIPLIRAGPGFSERSGLRSRKNAGRVCRSD